MVTSTDRSTMSKKRGPDELANEGARIRKMAKGEGAAGPSSSDKMLLGIETAQPLLLEDPVETGGMGGETNVNGASNNATPKKRGAGQKRGRSWNREEEVLLMEAWNKVALQGLKAKDVASEVEKEFHEMAVKKWGPDKQTTQNALDRKGGSLLARAKGLIRQFSELVTFAKTHTTATNFPHGLGPEELEKVSQEINAKRQAEGIEMFRSWHVRDALIYHLNNFLKSSVSARNIESSAKTQKRKSYPQDTVVARHDMDVERQKLELEKQRFKESQRVATLNSLHKLLSTLDNDDETIPIIREQILKLTTMDL